MTLADHILGWLAAGSMQRHELEERAKTTLGNHIAYGGCERLSSSLLFLTRHGLVRLHPVRGFCLTPAGRKRNHATTP